MSSILLRSRVLHLAMLTVLLLSLTSMVSAQRPGVQLELQDIKTEPTPVRTGEYADVWLKLRNTGNRSIDADDVVVDFQPTYPFSVDDDEQTQWELGTVTPGEEYQFRLQVMVDKNAVPGNNSLEFRTQSGNNDVAITKSVPIEVRTDDTALVVDDVQLPDRVAPGSTNDMTVTLRNLATSHFKDIDVELDLDDLPFAVGDTSRKRVQQLDGGDTTNVTYQLFTDAEAERGVSRLPVTLDYRNQVGNEFSKEQTTGVVVGGQTNIDVGLEQTELRTAGSHGEVTFRVVNRGEGQGNFVSITVPESDGYAIVSPRETYIGNMIPDDYQTASYDIYVEDGADAVTVPLQVSYVNAAGEMVDETQEVQLPLYDEETLAEYGLAGDRRGVLLPLLVVLVAVVGGVWYWRRRSG